MAAPQWKDVLAFDVFKQKIITRSQPPLPGAVTGEWLGHYDIGVADWLQRQGVPATPLTAGQAVCAVAHRSEFHPVMIYLDGLQWDGVPRLSPNFALF